MFRKLKLKFIFTNVLTSTLVIVVAFSSVYIVAASSAGRRIIEPFRVGTGRIIQVLSGGAEWPTERELARSEAGEHDDENSRAQQFTEVDFNKELDDRVQADREATLNGLLLSLIVTGVAMEAVIVLISVYLAEQSVKPVREAYEAQRAFVANASHEIKTPLAVIQANLEAADITGNHWIDNVQKKVDDLSKLNNELLTLARMDDANNRKIEQEKEDLAALSSEVTAYYLPQLQKKTAKLKLTSPKKLVVLINRADFEQILNILMDNAVKYCDKSVTVKLDEKSIKVVNDGTKIDKKDVKRIFERFYQADKTREGVGLGLSIAKQVAEANGWHLKAAPSKTGTVFSLEFK